MHGKRQRLGGDGSVNSSDGWLTNVTGWGGMASGSVDLWKRYTCNDLSELLANAAGWGRMASDGDGSRFSATDMHNDPSELLSNVTGWRGMASDGDSSHLSATCVWQKCDKRAGQSMRA